MRIYNTKKQFGIKTINKVINSGRKALIICLLYKGTSSALSGCIQDGLDVKNYLLTECGFLESEITMLTDDTPIKPTRENIIIALKQLVAGNNDKSKLFFHYSGHGSSTRDRVIAGIINDIQQKIKVGDELDGMDETICPLDYATAGQITDDELRTILVTPLVKGSKLTALFDSCHSGTVLDLRYTYTISLDNQDTSVYSTTENKKISLCDGFVTTISGCRDDQTSADAWINGKPNGAMTWSFLQTLKQLKSIGKETSYKNVIKTMMTLLKDSRYTQVPQISTGNLLNLGEAMSII